MIEVAFSTAFKRSLVRAIKNNAARQRRFEAALKLFVQDPFTESLKTHKLAGRLSGHYSFSVEYDLRAIFRFVESDKALFGSIGSHDEVYF